MSTDLVEASRIGYEAVALRVDRQVARVAELRTNTGVLTAATTIVGSVSIQDSATIDWTAIAALIFLALGLLSAIRPLWPLRDQEQPTKTEKAVRWVGTRLGHATGLVSLSGVGLVWRTYVPLTEGRLAAEGEPLQHTYNRLATLVDGHARANQQLIDRRSRWFMAAVILLAGQVCMWGIHLL